MLPLLVRVHHAESGVHRDLGFRRSPVRIGRNHLNDLMLDEPFVSQWHGIVRFDDEGTRFIDVGSTNGTTLNGARLEKNVEIELTPEMALVIGPLTLMFSRVPLDESQIVSRRASAFRVGDAPREAGLEKTVGLPGGSPLPDPRRSAPAPAPLPNPGAALAETARRMATQMAQLAVLNRDYEQSQKKLVDALRAAVDATTSPSERGAFESAVQGTFTLALEHPAVRELVNAPAPSGSVDAASWLTRLLGPSASRVGDPQQAMERVGALLETFARAYVDLRGGQQQVSTQLAVEPGGEASPLHEMTDARELLTYLLEGGPESPQRMDELSRAFADIVLHQLGMLNGAIEGARAVVHQLSPHAVGAVSPGSMVRTSPGFGDYLWPFRAAAHYYRYAARHMELSGEAKMTKILFGSAFSKAYYRVTGARSSGAPRKS
jgi:hypothetical protein